MNALLSTMKKHFEEEQFKIINELWLDFNSYNPEENDRENIYRHCKAFIQNLETLSDGFRNFALELRKNGDLCHNLMTFIEKKYIIEK